MSTVADEVSTDVSLLTSLASESTDNRPLHYTTNDIIHLLLACILLPLGIIGNILALIVFSKAKATNSFTILVRTLCIIDAVQVVRSQIGILVQIFTHNHIITYIGCDVGLILTVYFKIFSSALLVLITLERVIAVTYPFRAKSLCSVRNGIICVLVFGVFYMILACLPIGKTAYFRILKPCSSIAPEYAWVMPAVSLILLLCYSGIPIPLLILLNSILIYKLKRRQQVGVVGESSSSKAAQQHRLSIMALGLTCTFIVTTLPSAVMVMVLNTDGVSQYRLDVLAMLDELSTANHAANCILYSCCSSVFWASLKDLICYKRKATGHTGSDTTSAYM